MHMLLILGRPFTSDGVMPAFTKIYILQSKCSHKMVW